MVDINVNYEGELRCVAVHAPSTTSLVTDAPVDNQGRGSSFSPTDLVATGLGTCMLTTMGIRARKWGKDVTGATLHVKKHMTSEPPRRIRRLAVTLRMTAPLSAAFDPEQRAALRTAAETCPVRVSLLDAIEVPLELVWE
jgi:putative redox protein